MNVFESKISFIKTDPRIDRPKDVGYTVTADFMQKRHDAFFHEFNLTDCKVLDIGCCVAASGAYVLDHGASYYLGIEYQQDLVESSRQNLEEHYEKKKWDIIQDSFENFDTEQKFDFVIASGVIYTSIDVIQSMKKLTKWANTVLIESTHPKLAALLYRMKPMPYTQQPAFVTLPNSQMFYKGQFPGVSYVSARPSYRYCLEIMNFLGYTAENINSNLENILPDIYNYNNRFAIRFSKSENLKNNFGYVNAMEKVDGLEI
jgi:predicted nicotinamide N-methyase